MWLETDSVFGVHNPMHEQRRENDAFIDADADQQVVEVVREAAGGAIRNVEFAFATGYSASASPARYAGVSRLEMPLELVRVMEAQLGCAIRGQAPG